MVNYINPALTILSDKISSGKISWQTPSNIAIIKYWGKHGRQLPRNPSISFTLNNAFTKTTLAYQPKQNNSKILNLDFYFEGKSNPQFGAKSKKFLESITDIFPFIDQLDFTIQTDNSFPHSSGIASSASGMAAIAMCLCTIEKNLFGTLQDDETFRQKASYVARLGSGSACRSVYPTMAIWGQTQAYKLASDEYAVPFVETLNPVFKTYHDSILIASRGEKKVSSTAGHALMDGNIFAQNRYDQANQRFNNLLDILRAGDLHAFGKIAENEALTLHALMMTADASYILMRPATLSLIEKVQIYREETKQPLYFTLDAGPNLHLLYPDEIRNDVKQFIESDLVSLCEKGEWIDDHVGEGPLLI